jgi:hypothetical protein
MGYSNQQHHMPWEAPRAAVCRLLQISWSRTSLRSCPYLSPEYLLALTCLSTINY